MNQSSTIQPPQDLDSSHQTPHSGVNDILRRFHYRLVFVGIHKLTCQLLLRKDHRKDFPIMALQKSQVYILHRAPCKVGWKQCLGNCKSSYY
jgi:hypothetical protein